MSLGKYILTVVAKDEPGVVQQISQKVQYAGGNWLESSMSRLDGQFAGIVRIELDESHTAQLENSLSEISGENIQATIHSIDVVPVSPVIDNKQVFLTVEANDRPGIVEEISSALVAIKVNVENMSTRCESASMAGYSLFIAEMELALPNKLGLDDLELALESVSDDLMVTIQR